jgi:hypothetical protein
MSLKSYQYEFDVIDKVTAPIKRMAGAFGFANAKLQTFAGGIQDQGKKMGGFGGKLLNVKNLLVGSFVTSGVVSLGSELANTLGTFQKFEAVLTNTLGDRGAAKQVLGDITEFATKSPFAVDELTDSWVRLANQGFRPNMDQMMNLSDLAASTGKNFTDLSEAILDAQVGEFERLKEFGIRASKSGDKVTFSFKGQQKEVAFTEQAIQQYLVSLGKLQGVQGASAAIMDTTDGKLSNLGDRVTQLKLAFATALEPAITRTLDFLSDMAGRLTLVANWVRQNRDQVVSWAKVLGLVVGGFASIWAVARTIIGIQQMVATIKSGFLALSGALKIAKLAQMAFNLVASANPIGVIITLIGGAIIGFTALSDKMEGVRMFFGKVAKWMWDNHPFRWIIDLVDRVFPGFKDAVKGMLKSVMGVFRLAFEWLNKNIIGPFKGLLNALFGTDIGGSKVGVDDVVLEDVVDDVAKKVDPYAVAAPVAGATSSGGTKRAKSVDQRVAAVSGGGNMKHISINIQNLNEGGINIYETRTGLNVQQIKQELERMLLSVVNDVNYS